MNWQELLHWIEPAAAECQREAADLRVRYPRFSDEALVKKVISRARRRGLIAGAATGVASTPLTMLPAAVADAIAMLRIEAHMAGTVGALLDPASIQDEEHFRADLLAIVFPAAASQALRQVAIRTGDTLSKRLVRKYVTEDSSKLILRFAAKFLGVQVGEKAVVSKSIPLVGAGIGAAWNWMEVRVVAARALKYHREHSAESAAASASAHGALPPLPSKPPPLPALPHQKE